MPNSGRSVAAEAQVEEVELAGAPGQAYLARDRSRL